MTSDRIYLNPPKFWAATRNMTEQNIEQLTNELLRLADERKIEELSRYDFISFGHKRVAQSLAPAKTSYTDDPPG